jgi:hypothetical protein
MMLRAALPAAAPATPAVEVKKEDAPSAGGVQIKLPGK